MKVITKAFLTLLFVISVSDIRSAGVDCYQDMLKLVIKRPYKKIAESEWVLWNPKNSDAEIARHREEPEGTWGYARLKSGTHPLHTHREPEWYFIREGSGTMVLGEKVFTVKAGQEVYIPGDMPHAIERHPDSQVPLVFEYYFPGVKDYEDTVEYNWLATP